MLSEYIASALSRAKYKLIEDDEPYNYGEVLELKKDGTICKHWKNTVRIWLRLLMAGLS